MTYRNLKMQNLKSLMHTVSEKELCDRQTERQMCENNKFPSDERNTEKGNYGPKEI